MYCPKCRSKMKEEKSQKYSAMVCTRCQGIWISYDPDNMAEKIEDISHLDTGNPSYGSVYNSIKSIWCPEDQCNGVMEDLSHDHELARVEYEVCGCCKGLYFDAGELKQFADKDLIDQIERDLEDK